MDGLDAGVRIEQFDPKADTATIRACCDMTSAGWAEDHPDIGPWPLRPFTAKWTHGFGTNPQQCWLGRGDDGTPVGGYLLQLPDKENTNTGRCTLIVSPGRRRVGVGRALAAHSAEQARLAGRTRLSADVRDGSAGAAFAASLRAVPGIPEVSRRLIVDADLATRLARLRELVEPRTTGYSLVSWTGRTPEKYISGAVALHNAMADRPRDAGDEAKVWDAERIRETENVNAATGVQYQSVVARHDATGEIAAWTELCVDPDAPEWAYQLATVVLPAHRGHRLGLLVKIGNLELLGRTAPQVRRVTTGNASSNEHMIAINEQLGFQSTSVYRRWELDLSQPRADALSVEPPRAKPSRLEL
jgi:GNAT superfamily N-acetyltransferase